MIPDLPEGVSDENIFDFYAKIAGNLSDQSTIHIRWWTHRQNPSVCWICDMHTLTSKLLEVTDRYITKSTVDMETSSMSGNDSESEIENLNLDEEGVPEYDTEELETSE